MICYYSEKGDLQGVKRCIEQDGVDINYTSSGETALIRASYKGHLEIVKYLISKGADMDFAFNDRSTALIWASDKGHLEIVKVLVENGADLNKKSGGIFGDTALIRASKKGYFEIIKVLVEGGADVNIRNSYDEIALECSATDEIWDYLEDKTNDINLTKALCNFIERNNLGKVKYLVEKRGADINGENGEPLRQASRYGHLEMVKYLVEHGANVNAKDNYNNVALAVASECGLLEVVKYLLANGAIIDGYVLYRTALGGKVEVMKLLIENGADINSADIKASNEKGDTALIKAFKMGKTPMAQLLIENGADINAKNNEGKSALDYTDPNMFMGFL